MNWKDILREEISKEIDTDYGMLRAYWNTVNMKIQGISNSAGIHQTCGKSRMEYGIENGMYWYYCHNCKLVVDKRDIAVQFPVKI